MTVVCFFICVFIIFYVYAGYPFVITVLARCMPENKWPEFDQLPSLSLIISAYKEEQIICAKMENSLDLDYPAGLLEIMVVSEGNEDRTRDLVRGYADKGIVSEHGDERRGKAAALNRGGSRACGEIFVFSDANNLYSRDALLRLIAPFADPSVGLVTGAKRIRGSADALEASEGLYWKYESFIKKQESRFSSTVGVAGEILAVRKSLCPHLPEFVINDDAYIVSQIALSGKRIVYAPEAASYETISQTAKDESQRRERIFAGRMQNMKLFFVVLLFKRPLFFWQMLSHKYLRGAVPLAMLGALLFNVTALTQGIGAYGRMFSFMLAMFVAQLCFYSLAALSFRLESGTGLLAKCCYLPGFLVRSNISIFKGMVGYFANKQQVIWKRVPRRNG